MPIDFSKRIIKGELNFPDFAEGSLLAIGTSGKVTPLMQGVTPALQSATFNQSTASSLWQFNHTFGTVPFVINVYDTQGNDIADAVNIFATSTTVQISTDNSPVAGKVELYSFNSVAESVIIPNPIVSLLLKGNGTDGSTSIIDSSTYNLTPTKIGNPLISTNKSKFDGSSIYFDGASALDYHSSWFNVGSKNSTIELFFNADVIAGQVLFDMRPDNINGNYPQLAFDGNKIAVFYNTVEVIAGLAPISFNNWYYVALKKIGTLTELWLQGSKLGEFTSGDWASSGRIRLAQNAFYAPGTNFAGYIEQFRFTLDDARDVSVIPTAPF